MALSANTVWEVRTAGSDTNGGGFVAGAAGTDYSQQNSKNTVGNNISTTDAVANGTTTLTSATASFTSAIVGNILYLQGGSGSLSAVWRQVTGFTNATTITLDASVATGTGITMNIGGALASLGMVGASLVSGNLVWIKAGTYTITSTTANVSGGRFNNNATNIALVGYETSRGDFTTTRPLIQSQAALGTHIQCTVGGTGTFIANINWDVNSNTTSRAISANTVISIVYRCEVRNSTSTSAGITAQILQECSATGCSAVAFSAQTYSYCIAYSNSATPFVQPSASMSWIHCLAISNGSHGWSLQSGAQLVNCIAYGNSGDGFHVSSVATSLAMMNCLAVGNTGWGMNFTSGLQPAQYGILKNCATWNNTSGSITNAGSPLFIQSVTALSGDPFTNAAGNDFSLNNTAGAGAACRAAGFPGTLVPNYGTGYLDIGALQHQDSAGSTGGGAWAFA